ncbi:hypothetical protein IPG41_01595 [Candidatus Peregrinibacteria bacterium]|nr:MAG: hypothetical protein IPG41_01595 [Candidatus Peregrinibacteria bacterium]
MYTYYGIWIDHAKAFVLKGNKMGEFTLQFLGSNVEPHNHGGESAEHLTVTNQHRHEERRKNEMKAFSREILELIKDPDEIVIFGPGTAKHAFKHELEAHKALASKLKGVETSDHLSEAELKEFMKDYFNLPQH